ncbi:hypothetical protein [Luteipulveratus mongoliensis]|uniref:Uncharacterized protein n=1 Tax=Luteipulveratus mongoliensis TaxID=571913 RepID=A0A0K1JNP2_9MICO|nr:hypothetical protein [Luteipulveratus mongoliensis]AKU18198.1 hypothetical protein VV02_24020 [Luteipulveratus mongoliensis]
MTPGEEQRLHAQVAREQQTRAIWAVAENLRGSLINKGLLLAASLIVIDTLLVSHYQPATALALLRSTPTMSLLTGVLLNMGPVLINVGIVASLIRSVGAAAKSEDVAALTYGGVALGLLFLAGFVVDESMLIRWYLMVAIVVPGLTAAYFARKSADEDDLPGLVHAVALGIGLACVAVYLSTDTVRQSVMHPYLPPERIVFSPSTSEQSSTEIGYVLSTDNAWATIMRERDRSIIYRPVDTLVSRDACLLPQDEPVKPRSRAAVSTAKTPACRWRK